MVFKENFPLKSFNTFGVRACAKFFAEITSEEEIKVLSVAAEFKDEQKLILGGGSNLLFTKDFGGVVIKNSIKGIKLIEETETSVTISAGGGEIWDDLVDYCVKKNYGGIENLSLIPGTVGAAPIQNIGAYGVELEEVFHSLKGFYLKSGKEKFFLKEECEFNYRSSIFKRTLKNQFIITEVNLVLQKQPKINTTYTVLKNELLKSSIKNPNIKDISTIVKRIRRSKLPDVKNFGNAGSFFKNPIVSRTKVEELLGEYKDLVYFPVDTKTAKIAAGWLIEQCGLKGYKKGNAGTFENQAIVIVNHGNATGKEILELSKQIQESVLNKFKIELTPEVNII